MLWQSTLEFRKMMLRLSTVFHVSLLFFLGPLLAVPWESTLLLVTNNARTWEEGLIVVFLFGPLIAALASFCMLLKPFFLIPWYFGGTLVIVLTCNLISNRVVRWLVSLGSQGLLWTGLAFLGDKLGWWSIGENCMRG